MTEATVAAVLAKRLLDLAVSKGVDPKALVKRAGIHLAELDAARNRLGLASYVALMRTAQTLSDDPALALHFGGSPFTETGADCSIGDFAESGAEALALWNRYSNLSFDVHCDGRGGRYVVSRRGAQVWLVDTRSNPNDFPELTELTVLCMVSTSRRHVGDDRFVRAIHVTHGPPAYRSEYDRVFQLPVVFGSDRNAVLLADDGWLTQRPPSSSRVVLDALRDRAEALLEELEGSRTTRGRVESLLVPVLHLGGVTIESVAGKLGMSRHTLFRRLRAEGTSFERVLDELRRKLALQYLREKKASVNETAYRLGFSDRSAFSRAFKRWTGSRPRNRNSDPAVVAELPSWTGGLEKTRFR
jgi:AraC-like DNA-binding protein